MDGGGRFAQPLTGRFPGRGAPRAALAATASTLRDSVVPRLLAPLAGIGRRRRRSVAVPLARQVPRGLGTGLVLALFGAIGAYGLVLNGQYDELRGLYGEPRDVLARALGLGVSKVTISGLSHLSEIDVLTTGGITPRASLPFLGAADIRAKLEAVPLVKSADVRKLYPGDFAIALVEREPFALWQKDGELHVVAADGTVIDRFRDPGLVDLPLVVGDMANERAADYAALLRAAGPIRGKIRAGMLVSGRRWTLKMHNGLDVRLPETGAEAAVARLVRLDRETGLLGKDVLAVDLRIPDRVVVRLTEEATAARAEAVKKKPQRGVKGVDT